jgi:hypothetical protein
MVTGLSSSRVQAKARHQLGTSLLVQTIPEVGDNGGIDSDVSVVHAEFVYQEHADEMPRQ